MMMRSGNRIDWESIALGMIDQTTEFSVDLPSGLTAIRDNLFNGTKITAYTMPSSVTLINNYAFASCSLLTELPIGEGVTTINARAFQSCTAVESVTIPNAVTYIGNGAFYNCSNLRHVTIGNGVTNIVQGCFYNCQRLEDISVLATAPPTLGADAFSKTNDCPIYVPDESVAAYKAANNWSALASRIHPLSDLVGW
jgi:hypothetical protein